MNKFKLSLGLKFVVAFLTIFTIFAPYSALAIDPVDKKSKNYRTEFFNPRDVSCVNTDTSSSDGGTGAVETNIPSGAQSGSWNSGIQAPYILEQMMIQALKDIAKKTNTPEADILTQEHVIAMVGMAKGEGGDIANDSIFNPFNSGIDAPDLVNGGHSGDGHQQFKSFDAGVEAIARHFTQPVQSRFLPLLKDPKSTVQQFIYALTYYQRYPGNKIWAAGSSPQYDPNFPKYDWTKPGPPPAGYSPQGQKGQDDYYNRKLSAAQYVANHYADVAALVVGTAAHEEDIHLVHPELLQFHPNGGVSYTPLSNGGGSSGCGCPATGSVGANTPTPSANPGAPTIVIDPGHGAPGLSPDPVTGLRVANTSGAPGEAQTTFDIAQVVKSKLVADGYNVILTKNAVGDGVSHAQRAAIANNANAALAISIHYDGGGPFDDSAMNHIFPQTPGGWRSNDLDPNHRVTFPTPGTPADVATKSNAYSQIFVTERTKAEGHTVSILPLRPGDLGDRTSGNGEPLAHGNMWMVELLAKVPWVYNEIGAKTGPQQAGLTQDQQTKYANGLIAGVEKSIPLNGSSTTPTTGSTAPANPCGGGAVAGNIAQTAINLSWPSTTGPDSGNGNKIPTPQYSAALAAYGKNIANRGMDCGEFVGIVMRATGADPNYPEHTTGVQYSYVLDHPELYDVITKINSTADLQPGDILIVGGRQAANGSGHTMIWIGPQSNGTNEASASLNDRFPGLGKITKFSESRGDYLRARLRK